MLAATSSIVCQAEKMEAPSDSLSAAQDSIYKSLTLQEVKVTVPSKTRMNGDAMPVSYTHLTLPTILRV